MGRLRDFKKPPQNLSDVQREAEPPTAEQMRVLRRVADRILLEFALEKEDGDASAELRQIVASFVENRQPVLFPCRDRLPVKSDTLENVCFNSHMFPPPTR